jgi:hypothetical protein
MKSSVFALVLVSITTTANAWELRCWTNHYWGQSYSRCVPWYSEQELYQQRQNNALQNLERDTDGGRRRPSRAACINAIESGVANGTYGCRD